MSRTELWSEETTNELAIVMYLPAKNKLRYVPLGGRNIIGRGSADTNVDIQIDSPIVSRRHAQIVLQDNYFVYEDLASANGTYINGVLHGTKSGKFKKMIRMGDVIRIDHNDLAHPHQSAVIMVVVRAYTEQISTNTIKLEKCDSVTIGRNVGDLKLANRSISEKHAIFAENEYGMWTVEDCDSTNGVFINNCRIGKRVELRIFDVIRIADYIFIFIGDRLFYFSNESMAKQLVINIQERSVRKFMKKKILLQDINLSIKEGEMVMILGGSGAGKTTFVNAILGYEKAVGTIEHDNVDIYKEYNKVKGNMGFVPQQDLLRLEDTVYATLSSAAEMKMDANSTKQEREDRIDYVLNSLGLTREKFSGVKKLSGGQRKRLSIAVELISNPSLFFLDEPDSGLDGIMAKSLMQQLRVIADEGKIVMVITHAPDRVRELFDKVVILAKGEQDNIGHLAFFGAVDEAMKFFDTDSLEGVVKRINRKDEGGDGMSDYYIEKYAQNKKGTRV